MPTLAFFGALSFAAAMVAQDPAPTPPPSTPPPAQARPATPAPAETAPDPQSGAGDRQGRGGSGGRRRGQGPAGGQGLTELPEFTPVAAPGVEGLQGKQSFWFTMYPNFVAQFDPVTDTVTRKVELKRGMFWSTHLTHDRRRMLVVTDQQQSIEVVDLVSGTVTGEHRFAEDGFILRIRDVRECPGGMHWLVRTERIKKEIDRYSFEAAQWILYDVENHKVVRKVARLPEAIDRRAELSADGTQWLAQDGDGNLEFLDARTFKPQGRIDLKTPRFAGAGAIRLSGTDLLDRRDPRRALMLFTTTDPVETRRTNWGLVELDLAEKKIVRVDEWGPSQSTWGLRVASHKPVGCYMSGGFGGERSGDNRSRLVMVDMTNGTKIAEAYEEFRPRRSLVAISPAGDKVYIGVAGSDFEVFDAQLKRLKTVELDGEIVGRIHVVDG